MRLDGRVAFVTGGASGIGEAAARAFAEAGAAVAVVDLRSAEAESVARSIQAAGGKAAAFAADVGQEAQVKAAIDGAVEQLGGLNVVFANAGINGMQTAIEEM